MAIAVFDASVVIALLDEKDAHHRAALSAVGEHRDHQGILPASAYSECLVLALRKSEKTAAVIERAIADHALDIVAIDRAIGRRAAELRARHTDLRLPDALVLAAGDVLQADAILTADRTWTKYSRRAKVI